MPIGSGDRRRQQNEVCVGVAKFSALPPSTQSRKGGINTQAVQNTVGAHSVLLGCANLRWDYLTSRNHPWLVGEQFHATQPLRSLTEVLGSSRYGQLRLFEDNQIPVAVNRLIHANCVRSAKMLRLGGG